MFANLQRTSPQRERVTGLFNISGSIGSYGRESPVNGRGQFQIPLHNAVTCMCQFGFEPIHAEGNNSPLSRVTPATYSLPKWLRTLVTMMAGGRSSRWGQPSRCFYGVGVLFIAVLFNESNGDTSF